MNMLKNAISFLYVALYFLHITLFIFVDNFLYKDSGGNE